MLRDRLVVLNDTDQALAEIFKFNQELAEFDKTLNSHLLDTRGDQSCKEVDGGAPWWG